MNDSISDAPTHASAEANCRPDSIAIGLLTLQERFDALDRLYNEEVGSLSLELARLKADYVRLFQARPTLRRAKKASHAPAHPSTSEA